MNSRKVTKTESKQALRKVLKREKSPIRITEEQRKAIETEQTTRELREQVKLLRGTLEKIAYFDTTHYDTPTRLGIALSLVQRGAKEALEATEEKS